MNSSAFVISIVVALALTVTGKSVVVNPSKPIHTPKAESPLRCGGVLNEPTGGISYKPYETILPNERCVWAIQSGSAEGYNVNVLRLGSEEGVEVSATCVRGPWVVWEYTIASVGQFNRSMTECPVLLITLLSSAGSQTSKGFILEYEARETTGSTKISPTSRQQITNADTGHIRYPGNGQNYTNSEVSTFIFTPRDNFYQAKKNTTVTFVEDWMDDVHCYDEIHVFHLVDSSAGGKFYDWASAVCPGTDMKVLSNHDDIIIAVFMTDENRTGSGFHLIHSRSTW